MRSLFHETHFRRQTERDWIIYSVRFIDDIRRHISWSTWLQLNAMPLTEPILTLHNIVNYYVGGKYSVQTESTDEYFHSWNSEWISLENVPGKMAAIYFVLDVSLKNGIWYLWPMTKMYLRLSWSKGMFTKSIHLQRRSFRKMWTPRERYSLLVRGSIRDMIPVKTAQLPAS